MSEASTLYTYKQSFPLIDDATSVSYSSPIHHLFFDVTDQGIYNSCMRLGRCMITRKVQVPAAAPLWML